MAFDACFATGTLTVNGTATSLVNNISYSVDSKYVDFLTGYPQTVKERRVVAMGARLTAEVYELKSGLLSLLIASSTNPIPTVTATFVSLAVFGKTVTITFSSCNVLPKSTLNFTKDGIAVAQIEVISLGDTMPTVT